jgi:hypothetical protein
VLNKRSLTESQSNEGEGDQGTYAVQDANGAAAAGEDDTVAADRVVNAVAAEHGEIIGAEERQENVRETKGNVSGKKRRRQMVPEMPLDHPGISPVAFRSQYQRYVGTYPIHVELPVPDSQNRKTSGRRKDKGQRARRTCTTCARSDCNGARTRVPKGQSKECSNS